MTKRGMLRGLIVLIVILCVSGIAISGYKLVTIRQSYKMAEDEYADLEALIKSERMAASGEREMPAGPATATAGQTQSVPIPLVQLDFRPLKEKNADAVAWITVENSRIDYPIVQGEDNEFYLDHLFSKRWGFSGAIFMDTDNAADFSDQNTVIYGHRLNNAAMFTDLSRYRNQSYYDKHPVMRLFTPNGDYDVLIFSAYNRDASAIPHRFTDDKAFEEYLGQIKAKSDFRADVDVSPGDRIVTLATCSYVFDNARYVVHGKLVPLYE